MLPNRAEAREENAYAFGIANGRMRLSRYRTALMSVSA
ncbi:hypothetical protein PAMC26577_11510 [Caballeronia sordidicola]|uniref:Uncharacterized protein n=1 Tax=Caballeronia sordidicola TaxID=196367 RepID=A0A242MXS9_CABSO|nr:hypothetical protein PAMC26577_11510 [Caballeronia sordidicola]